MGGGRCNDSALSGGVEGMMARRVDSISTLCYLFPTSGSDRGRLENVTGGVVEGNNGL